MLIDLAITGAVIAFFVAFVAIKSRSEFDRVKIYRRLAAHFAAAARAEEVRRKTYVAVKQRYTARLCNEN